MHRSRRHRPTLLSMLSALALSACIGMAGCSSDDIGESGDGELLFTHVHYKDAADLQRMVEELDVLEDADRSAGWIAVLIDQPAQYDALIASGHRVDIIRRETVRNRHRTLGGAEAAGIPGYTCYRTVEETHAAMNRIAETRPNLAAVVNIGPSWNKENHGTGYDLRVLKLTNGAIAGPKPAFFLMGAIHAREYATAETALRFAEEMANGYGTDPDTTWLLDHYELHVLPLANPDGRKIAEQRYYQRKNQNDTNGAHCANPPTMGDQFGIDLNRNSSFQYGGSGSTTDACDQSFRGSSPVSEPETRSIQNYIVSLFPDQRGPNLSDAAPEDATGLVVSLHSYAEKVLFPWSWSGTASPNESHLRTLGRKFGYFNGYEVCQWGASDCLYLASGTTDDWSYGELGVASYTFEMGRAFFESCSSYEESVGPKNISALRYAFKSARRPYQTPSGPESLQVTVSPASVRAGTPVTLTALADDTRTDSHGHGLEPTENIQAARYSIDAPSWAPGASPAAMAAADGAFDTKAEGVTAIVDTTGLAPGRHIVLVEGQDAAHHWGPPSAVFVQIE